MNGGFGARDLSAETQSPNVILNFSPKRRGATPGGVADPGQRIEKGASVSAVRELPAESRKVTESE